MGAYRLSTCWGKAIQEFQMFPPHSSTLFSKGDKKMDISNEGVAKKWRIVLRQTAILLLLHIHVAVCAALFLAARRKGYKPLLSDQRLGWQGVLI